MFGTTYLSHWNWQKLLSYGEVLCFVSAWTVGLVIAMQGQRTNNDRPPMRTFASATDTLGFHAALTR